MEVYKFLWWKGRASLDSVLQHFSKNVMEDLDWLLKEKKISVHREPLGDLWIRCPAYVKKDPILELITLEPGITPTEAIERLGMTRKDFYQRLKKLDVEKVSEGRNTKLYIREESVEPLEDQGSGSHTPEPQEAHSEPVEEPEDPLMEQAREVWENFKYYEGFDLEFEEVLEDLRSGGDRVEKWVLSQLSDLAHVVLEEFEEFDLEDLMEKFSLTRKEAAKLRNELISFNLAEATEEGTWIVK